MNLWCLGNKLKLRPCNLYWARTPTQINTTEIPLLIPKSKATATNINDILKCHNNITICTNNNISLTIFSCFQNIKKKMKISHNRQNHNLKIYQLYLFKTTAAQELKIVVSSLLFFFATSVMRGGGKNVICRGE